MSKKTIRHLWWVGLSYSIWLALSPADVLAKECEALYNECMNGNGPINCEVFSTGFARTDCFNRKARNEDKRKTCSFNTWNYHQTDDCGGTGDFLYYR